MFDTPQDITRLQTLKGGFFVLITSLLLFILVWKNYRKVERAFQLDGLTGLPSHHMFNIQLERRLAMLGNAQKLVVGYLDINRFKELNQAVGFEYADQFLVQFGRAIENASPQVIIVGRLPPDQFAMALELNSADDIDEYVRGCQLLFDRTARKMGLDASCSMGVSVYPDDGANAKALMNAAADALAQAKADGSPVQYHDKSLSARTSERRKMVEDLKDAIVHASFSLVYQPKYVIGSQAVSGVEVLIRWYHPVKGYISPAEFIPLAEENGLSTAITRIVVERAASELEQSGLLGSRIQHVAINVSATEFNDPQGMDSLLACLKTCPGLMPYARIEITETATLKDMQQSSQVISKLRREGLSFSIDDFGTGYTSLAMLKDFTIDEIKIDRSFVSGLEESGRSRTIVAAIIAMANSFQINVVAEGVETEAQLGFLKTMGCREVQGYLLGVPMAIATLREHLDEQMPDRGLED